MSTFCTATSRLSQNNVRSQERVKRTEPHEQLTTSSFINKRPSLCQWDLNIQSLLWFLVQTDYLSSPEPISLNLRIHEEFSSSLGTPTAISSVWNGFAVLSDVFLPLWYLVLWAFRLPTDLMHKLEYSNRFCSLLIEEPYFWLVANWKKRGCKKLFSQISISIDPLSLPEILFVLRLGSVQLQLLYSWKVRRLKRAWDVLKRVTWQGIKNTPSANDRPTNDHYQMIIKWSHSFTLKQFSHFLIVGFLCFLGIQSSTWCSHNTKTSCCFKALEKCWNSFNVSRYALVSGHPGGGGRGDPKETPVICTTTFTNPPYPKTRSFNEKLIYRFSQG